MRTTYSKELNEGAAPLMHVALLANHPERMLALRMALERAIRPGSAVLDAGCGAVGVLSILSARLGAAPVVGVDFGPVPLAERLAEENGVDVTFVAADLADLATGAATRPERFDVVLAMVYANEPWRDLAQHRLVAGLGERLGRPGVTFVPNRVRYTVAGFAATQDPSGSTRSGEWGAALDRIEGQTGLSLRAARALAGPSAPAAPSGTRFGHPDRSGLTQLTGGGVFAEIDYGRPETVTYPASVRLHAERSGRLETVIWRQELFFDDLLIRSFETTQAVVPSEPVEPGETVTLTYEGVESVKEPLRGAGRCDAGRARLPED